MEYKLGVDAIPKLLENGLGRIKECQMEIKVGARADRHNENELKSMKVIKASDITISGALLIDPSIEGMEHNFKVQIKANRNLQGFPVSREIKGLRL